MNFKASAKPGFKAGCLFIPALLLLLTFTVLYGFRDRIAVAAGKSMVVEDAFEFADAVLVLGGSIPDRLLEAVALYEENKSDLILITKTLDPLGFKHLEDKNADYPLNHEIKIRILSILGIGEENFKILEGKMPNTYYEALNAHEYMLKHNLESLVVTTSKLHTRRASIIFNDVADGSYKVYVKPSRYDPFDPDDPDSVKNHLKTLLFEFQKIAFYKLTDIFSAEYPRFL